MTSTFAVFYFIIYNVLVIKCYFLLQRSVKIHNACFYIPSTMMFVFQLAGSFHSVALKQTFG